MSRHATDKYDGRFGNSPGVTVETVVEKRQMIVAPRPGRCTGPLHREDAGMNDVRKLILSGRRVGNAAGMRRPECDLHRDMPGSMPASNQTISLETHRDPQLDAVAASTTRNRSIP